MGWKIYDEAIEVLQRQFQWFPQVFRWRGRRYQVEAVEQCWTVSRSGWRRRVKGHYFELRCAEGRFEVFQDVESNAWRLRRAKLNGLTGAIARQPAPAWR